MEKKTSKVVGSSKDDNLNEFQAFEKQLDAIVEKIVAQENEYARLGVYLKFVHKHPDYIDSIMNRLYNNHPLVFKELSGVNLQERAELEANGRKQNSGCMVALLIIIAPTILLSLLIF